MGIIFCSVGEAVQGHRTSGRIHGLGVPYSDNFYARSTRPVVTDGSFVYITKAEMPME